MQAKLKFAFCSLFTLFCFLSSPANSEKKVKQIPREILFSKSVKYSPHISPDGEKIAYLSSINGTTNIFVKTCGKNDDAAVTHETEQNIGNFFWSYEKNTIFYFNPKNGHLHTRNIETKEEKDVTPFENVKIGAIISYNKQFPNEIVLTLNTRDPHIFDVHKLNLRTGQLDLIEENPGNFLAWIVDANNKVRAAKTPKKDGGYDGILKDENANWETFATWTLEDNFNNPWGKGRGDFLIDFSKDGKELYAIDSRDAETSRLVSIDTKSGEIKVLFEDPVFDVGYTVMNPDTRNIEAAIVYRTRKEWVFFDKQFKKDMQEIRKLDDGDICLISRDSADQKWIVSFYKPYGPESFWLFDRQTKKGKFLFYDRPELKNYTLANMEPISFIARDGLKIHGYLTVPVGKTAKNLPLVLKVHGGPNGRDIWGYHPETQWLANKGYAVLQVNFRGSTGYGKKLLNEGNKGWGGKMQDDLEDAVKWAITSGIANPKKICAYGFSYGGYAALVGAALQTDLFCCAVDICGPNNLISLLKSRPPAWKNFMSMMHKRIGNPDKEEAFLQSRSPRFYADKIKVPVFIVSGGRDFRVNRADTDEIIKHLQENKVDYEYLLFEDEGHWITKEENKERLYSAAEKFLASYLG